MPLAHNDNVVGVMGVDTWKGVAKGRDDEEHPEAGIVEFISSVAAMTGAAVDRRRKRIALGKLALATQEVDVTADDIEQQSIAILNKNILFAQSVSLSSAIEAEAPEAMVPAVASSAACRAVLSLSSEHSFHVFARIPLPSPLLTPQCGAMTTAGEPLPPRIAAKTRKQRE